MPNDSVDEHVFVSRVLEAAIRIALVGVLVVWCSQVLAPFMQPMAWSVIIAVAIHPLHVRLERALGGHSKSAASLLTLTGLLLLLVPMVLLTGSLMETASVLSGDLSSGRFSVPAPPTSVSEIPVVGDRIYSSWLQASQNLDSVMQQFAPQLRTSAQWIVTTAAATGMGVLKFILSMIFAGVLLANAPGGRRAADAIATRLIGDRGTQLTNLSIATIQNVTRGILGVAIIQSLLTGIGCLAVGVPAAGFFAILVLMLAIVQLPSLLVSLPLAIYVFGEASMPVAVMFLVFNLAVGLSDNILKPMLMSRGVDVPMAVIFLGSVGGFMLDGIIGLVVGAVLLSLGYNLFIAWLYIDPDADEPDEGIVPRTSPSAEGAG